MNLLILLRRKRNFEKTFFRGLGGRRKKSAFMLTCIWAIAFVLHIVSWGSTAVFGATGLLLIQAIRLVSQTPDETPTPLTDEKLETAPTVSLVVSAKNEGSCYCSPRQKFMSA